MVVRITQAGLIAPGGTLGVRNDSRPQIQLSGTVVRHCLIRSVALGADLDLTVGQCLVSDEKSACWILIGHRPMVMSDRHRHSPMVTSDSVCRTAVPGDRDL